MPEVTDLMRVAQYVKSDKTAPSEVYNAACRVLDEQEAARIGAEKLLNLSLDEGRRADRAEAAIERVRAMAVRAKANAAAWRAEHGQYTTDELDADDVLSALNGAESHGDGRTPQTQGASEGQGVREAQEAAE